MMLVKIQTLWIDPEQVASVASYWRSPYWVRVEISLKSGRSYDLHELRTEAEADQLVSEYAAIVNAALKPDGGSR